MADALAHRYQLETLNVSARRALQAGDAATAAALLEQAVALEARQPPLWLNLAAAYRACGRIDAALGAVDGALRAEPRNVMALLMKGSLLERADRMREAAPVYGVALSLLPADAPLDPATRRAVDHARAVNQRYGLDLQAYLRDRIASDAPSERRRAEIFVEHLVGRRRIYRQEPSGYYFPGLPAIEFWDRSEFPWLAALEACTVDIQAELRDALRAGDDDLSPYLQHPDSEPLDQWAELNNSRRWSAYHLLQDGARVEAHCRACPRTLAALQHVPQPHVVRRSPSAMFSVLEPHTRIPAHTGVANTRLVLHLPLVSPPGCGFRVGNETREWREGEAWVFDDTIEHEAWNDSDLRRVVMIVDVWNPRLTELDRRLIAEIIAGMDAFNGVASGAAAAAVAQSGG